MENLNKKEILDRLRSDEDYYGEFGRQFRSNSDISTLLTNPLALGTPQKPNINFLVGGYFPHHSFNLTNSRLFIFNIDTIY